MSRAVLLATPLVLTALAVGTGVATAADHSGIVVSVNRDAGTIVIGEVGPWRVKDGKTEITRRTLAVGPGTQFAVSRRIKDPGPTGWPGGFVEEALGPWEVKAGDFVTVRVENEGKRPAASRVTVTVVEGG